MSDWADMADENNDTQQLQKVNRRRRGGNHRHHHQKTKFRVCFSVINNADCLNEEGKCDFAHTLEEFEPKICRHNEHCKNINEDCTKWHPKVETKVELLTRIGLCPRKWKIENSTV